MATLYQIYDLPEKFVYSSADYMEIQENGNGFSKKIALSIFSPSTHTHTGSYSSVEHSHVSASISDATPDATPNVIVKRDAFAGACFGRLESNVAHINTGYFGRMDSTYSEQVLTTIGTLYIGSQISIDGTSNIITQSGGRFDATSVSVSSGTYTTITVNNIFGTTATFVNLYADNYAGTFTGTVSGNAVHSELTVSTISVSLLAYGETASFSSLIGSTGQVGNFIVDGDLTVNGALIYSASSTLTILELNDGEAGAGVTGTYSGIKVDRGSLDSAWLVFNETNDKFLIGIAATASGVPTTQAIAIQNTFATFSTAFGTTMSATYGSFDNLQAASGSTITLVSSVASSTLYGSPYIQAVLFDGTSGSFSNVQADVITGTFSGVLSGASVESLSGNFLIDSSVATISELYSNTLYNSASTSDFVIYNEFAPTRSVRINDSGGNIFRARSSDGATFYTDVHVSSGKVLKGANNDGAWTVATTHTSMTKYGKYAIDTSGAGVTCTLPVAPASGDYVYILDYTGNWNTNNVSIVSATANIFGTTGTLTLDVDYFTGKIEYIDATQGWRIV